MSGYESWLFGLVALSTIGTAAWGIYNIKNKVPLLFRLVIYGIGCLGLGRLFETVMLTLYGYLPSNFHVGLLAIIGGFMFFFSSYYGQLDGLIDEGESKYRKYRIIPFIGPLMILLVWGMMFIIPAGGNEWLTLSVCVFLLPTAYYSTKYVFYPDNGSGMANSLRKYSATLMVLTLIYGIEIVCIQQSWNTIWTIACVLECVAYPIMLVSLRKGCLTWTT